MAKLDTTEALLEWVFHYKGSKEEDATLTYLAECVRLRQAFDAFVKGRDWSSGRDLHDYLQQRMGDVK